MRWVEETHGGNPTRGVLLSLNEILDSHQHDPKRAQSHDWLCRGCSRQVALLYGHCGSCWLSAWKEAHE